LVNDPHHLVAGQPGTQLLIMRTFISLSILFLSLVTIGCKAQTAQPHKTHLSVEEFDKLSKEIPEALIVDVRHPVEYVEGYIPNAVNITYDGKYWLQVVNTLDTAKTYFLYCASGIRSTDAGAYMESQGIKKIYYLQPGYDGWLRAGMPTATHNVNLRDRQ
jgi:rhodanese-related sulfurtransferase